MCVSHAGVLVVCLFHAGASVVCVSHARALVMCLPHARASVMYSHAGPHVRRIILWDRHSAFHAQLNTLGVGLQPSTACLGVYTAHLWAGSTKIIPWIQDLMKKNHGPGNYYKKNHESKKTSQHTANQAPP